MPSNHRSLEPTTEAALVPAPLPVPAPMEGAHETHDPRRSDVDGWGRSESARALFRALYDPIYRHWLRVEWDGMERLPASGGALLVANHAGAVPSDAVVVLHGIETQLGRRVYGMGDDFFGAVPVVGTLWARLGGVVAHPDNAFRILHDEQQLAIVFPEGTKATGKPYSERYRLRRFGRGGFVEIAMRAGVPVVPVAIVGGEEAMPLIAKLPAVGPLSVLPYIPITANMLAFGPLGIVLPFPAKFRLRVLEPVRFDVPPGQERYSKSRVMEESEAIRTRMQEAIFDMLRERESVWFG
ncbi:MAG TPA: lysophospholipid acyltransferase family protein [Acidimicrobiales bacterium]|nr:lysophospholipid acyltransferase family protein [Acidimicrobiales bacterium]